MKRHQEMLMDVVTMMVIMWLLLVLRNYAVAHPFRAVVISMCSGIALVVIRQIIIKILGK